MHDHHNEQPSKPQVFRDGLSLVVTLIYLNGAWAKVIHAVVRVPGSCGKDYFGFQALVGWLWLPIFAATIAPRDPSNVCVLFVFWCLVPLFIVHRIRSIRHQRQGLGTHSQYIGDSWLQYLLPFLKPETVKPGGEIQLCLACGLLLIIISPALGLFIMLGGIASGIDHSLILARDRRQLDEMEDVLMEQEYLAEQFQERLNNRRNRR